MHNGLSFLSPLFVNHHPGRQPGGTRNGLLTAASSRTWRGSQVSAAPDPPGQPVAYRGLMCLSMFVELKEKSRHGGK